MVGVEGVGEKLEDAEKSALRGDCDSAGALPGVEDAARAVTGRFNTWDETYSWPDLNRGANGWVVQIQERRRNNFRDGTAVARPQLESQGYERRAEDHGRQPPPPRRWQRSWPERMRGTVRTRRRDTNPAPPSWHRGEHSRVGRFQQRQNLYYYRPITQTRPREGPFRRGEEDGCATPSRSAARCSVCPDHRTDGASMTEFFGPTIKRGSGSTMFVAFGAPRGVAAKRTVHVIAYNGATDARVGVRGIGAQVKDVCDWGVRGLKADVVEW